MLVTMAMMIKREIHASARRRGLGVWPGAGVGKFLQLSVGLLHLASITPGYYVSHPKSLPGEGLFSTAGCEEFLVVGLEPDLLIIRKVLLQGINGGQVGGRNNRLNHWSSLPR